MFGTIMKTADAAGRRAAAAASGALILLVMCVAAPAIAYMDIDNPVVMNPRYNPNGVFELNGDFVMNVGEVQVNITNWGLIGSMYSSAVPWSDAPSCQWPAGSGHEYLWSAGLWVGGIMLGERLCSTGGWGSEIYPLQEIEYTIYEAIDTKLLRPQNVDASGRREPMPNPDDDGDGKVDEEILNGFDDDGDGEIDEDFGQIGNQMFVLTQYDNTSQAREAFPDHTPMNLEIIQTSFQWENDQVDDFVGFDYTITNIGVTPVEKVYIGFYADSDIGARSEGSAEDDMAGSWPRKGLGSGLVRASDGTWVKVNVGYMWDAPDPEDQAAPRPIPGYFGIVFLGHDVDPTGIRAPRSVGMRTFQSFAGRVAFEQGGDPNNDDERYQLLSADFEDWDDNTIPGKQADFRFLVSAGPFLELPPGEQLTFQVAMVMGPGLGNELGEPGLLANCAEAVLTWYGVYVDEIKSVQRNDGVVFNPGQLGRETLLCEEDFATPSGNPFNEFRVDFMDDSCLSPTFTVSIPPVSDEERFEIEIDGEVKTCAMFNMDNCFECSRQLGRTCFDEDFTSDQGWNCNDPLAGSYVGCTGFDGNEKQVHWLVGMAPPPPGMRVWPTDNRVHIFWDNRSEVTPDIRTQKLDFESYRLWRADNWERPFGSSLENGPESNLWQLIDEFDIVNTYVSYRVVDGTTYLDTIPLGQNTGLDVVRYRPVCLDDPTYEGLEEAMNDIVMADVDDQLKVRPEVRNAQGEVVYPTLLPWETYPDVMDTFFLWAERPEAEGVTPKDRTNFYEYVDRDVHNGFIYFYSVTATDFEVLAEDNAFGIDGPVGPGLSGDPGSSFRNTTPGTVAQTAEERERNGVNIYVYPNPATRDALAEYQELFPNGDDPTGVRVTFANLPMARNTISIYTVSGDLVQTIAHDGTEGQGHASWNLMSRNGQEIVSGIYLYAVQSDDDRFEDFVGKFVVVR